VKVCLVGSLEIEHVSHRLGHADAEVERVYDRLTEVFFHSCLPQATQIYTMEVLLIPKNYIR
jgi:hypothetical protein